jgi:hypothetical protein
MCTLAVVVVPMGRSQAFQLNTCVLFGHIEMENAWTLPAFTRTGLVDVCATESLTDEEKAGNPGRQRGPPVRHDG